MGQNGGHDDDDDDRKDLTRIEDLSEFLHSNDQDVDDKFDFFDPKKDVSDLSSTAITIDELPLSPPEEAEEVPEIPEEALPEIPMEESSFSEASIEADSLGDSFSTSFDENADNTESTEDMPESDSSETLEEASPMDFSTETFSDENSGLEESPSDLESFDSHTPTDELQSEDHFERSNEVADEIIEAPQVEKFQDVKNFAQNFSYGQTQGGGNPPYSIIVRHIRYDEDAEDILSLLQEFGVVTESNLAETKKALSFGSLIIPQISEYCAIVIAHKLRRFDLDLEVGLSDEVHPSKSGEQNPKGLLKRDSLKQNRSESLKLSDLETSIKDIIITTSSSAEGYHVEKYIGIQTTFSIVEEEELEKLQYVQKTFREGSDLFEYQTNDKQDHEENISTNKAFRDYQNSFALIYESLARELRQKAFTQKANALLGLNYQLSPLQFERNHRRISAYQITCSATLAVVMKEDA